MKFIIEADIVERHPEGLVVLAIDNGFGAPHVQFDGSKIVPYDGTSKP